MVVSFPRWVLKWKIGALCGVVWCGVVWCGAWRGCAALLTSRFSDLRKGELRGKQQQLQSKRYVIAN